MRFRGGLAAILLVLTREVLPSSAIAAQGGAPSLWRNRISAAVRDTVLSNGLTIVVAENHAVPITTVEVAFRGGASMQERGEEGLAHLAEHYLFRSYGDDGAFAADVANLNGTYNGSTSEEEVNYFVIVPSKQTAPAIGVMARLVREPKFNDKALSAEKKVVADELARDRSDAGSFLETEVERRLWGDSWWRKDVGGSKQSVDRIKLDRMRSLIATQYVPSNAAVIVSGDVSPVDAIAEAVRRFGDWRSAAAPIVDRKLSAMPSTTTRQIFAVSASDVKLVTVAIQWPGPSVRQTPAEAVAAEVFSQMLNSDISPAVGRLISTGVVHAFSMSADTRDGRGPFTLRAVVTGEGVERALSAIREEMDRFATSEYMNDSLLTAGKKRLSVNAEHWLESGSGVAQTIGSIWSVANLEYFRSYGDAVDHVSLSQVDALVKKYMVGQPFVAGALSPGAQLDRTRAAMSAAFAKESP